MAFFKRTIEELTRQIAVQEDAADEAASKILILEGNSISRDLRRLKRQLALSKAGRRILSFGFAK